MDKKEFIEKMLDIGASIELSISEAERTSLLKEANKIYKEHIIIGMIRRKK